MVTIKTLFQPTSKRPCTQDRADGGTFGVHTLLRNNFSVLSWVLVGASLQALAVYLFSSGRYVLLISTIALFAKFGKTVLQTLNVLPNPYLQDVIPGRTTALLPDEDTGEITEASSRDIVVLHLGAKSNHPLGYFAPQFTKVGDWLGTMNKKFDAGKIPGFLGQTTFHRHDRRGAPEVILISYWSSIEALHEFAHTDTHRKAWQWWEKTIKDNGYVGINHEIGTMSAKNWENVYVNFQPTLMGATTHLVKGGNKLEGGTVPDQWISGLVDARRGPLARSSGRLGRNSTVYDDTRVAKETYDA